MKPVSLTDFLGGRKEDKGEGVVEDDLHLQIINGNLIIFLVLATQ